MRIFKTCEDMIKEMDRDLMVQGITCRIKHYQNKKLTGDEQITKELIGVAFTVSKPLLKRTEMLQHIFPKDFERIENYCKEEFKDRVCGKPLNPGNSYIIRKDLWQKFLVGDDTKFDYTYSERIWWQLPLILETLKEDKHTRQAVMSIWEPEDLKKTGGDTRIPCSLDFSFMIRNDRLYCVYHMRSNDFLGHMPIDIYLASELMSWIVEQLNPIYKELQTGSLIYFANSLHAYSWDLSKRLVF